MSRWRSSVVGPYPFQRTGRSTAAEQVAERQTGNARLDAGRLHQPLAHRRSGWGTNRRVSRVLIDRVKYRIENSVREFDCSLYL
jgi:hypothetical protein